MDKKLTISVKKYSGETSVVSLRMPDELIKKVDLVAEKTGRTRNEIIIKCLDYAIDNMIIDDKAKEEE